ncbi:hypothetical protein EVAR_428_1 [Eumeta japonica]|uniref:Uncharacterized protein n=1 Tax=Eumeta variegata TaxID=151549 RepID=A0A4C1SDB6_EUMVA|nr:hypothetical protein EVAR_428_1 [Eumeta japonica]
MFLFCAYLSFRASQTYKVGSRGAAGVRSEVAPRGPHKWHYAFDSYYVPRTFSKYIPILMLVDGICVLALSAASFAVAFTLWCGSVHARRHPASAIRGVTAYERGLRRSGVAQLS